MKLQKISLSFTAFTIAFFIAGLVLLAGCETVTGSEEEDKEQAEQAEDEHPFAGGSGNEEDPYEIETLEQLNSVRDYLDRHFIQTSDIDASGRNLRPIGSIDDILSLSGDTFTGSFDGNGYSITGLIVDWEGDQINGVGLFGLASGNAEFKNITLEEVSIKGYQMVGALVGAIDSDSVTIMNSYATGEVSGWYNIGGLVGEVREGKITGSYSECSIKGKSAIGGLVGQSGGMVTNSYATGQISATSAYAGGLVGRLQGSAIIRDSYATGDIDAAGVVGGLVGESRDSSATTTPEIIDSYAEGNVKGEIDGNSSNEGGLVGSNGGRIQNSYAIGNVTGRWDTGGLVGENYEDGEIIDSYSEGAVEGSLGEGSGTGGLVGSNKGGLIAGSSALGNVTGDVAVGGLAGVNASSGLIKNSKAENKVRGIKRVGGLVGSNGSRINNTGKIENSYASGEITGETGVGGLVGQNYEDGEIIDSYSKGTVEGSSRRIGGLVGRNFGGLITGSSALGNVTGEDYVGGLVGINTRGGLIENSKAENKVRGIKTVGGLVGLNSSGEIENSYTIVEVTGDLLVGGLVGKNGDAQITNSYAVAEVSGDTRIGSFAGYLFSESDITSSYWDSEKNSNVPAVGDVRDDSADNIIGLTTSEMQGTSAKENMTGFDFEEVWVVTDSYPALFWE